jgi:hypothetical protein
VSGSGVGVPILQQIGSSSATGKYKDKSIKQRRVIDIIIDYYSIYYIIFIFI